LNNPPSIRASPYIGISFLKRIINIKNIKKTRMGEDKNVLGRKVALNL
jgi:hypothetical protein